MVDSTERDTDTGPEQGSDVNTAHIYEGMNIHQRINAARTELGGIERSAVHTIFKDGKKVGQFDYITHDDVTAHIKPVVLRWGINPWPTVSERSQNGNRTELIVDTTFFNIDDPSDNLIVRTLGFGADGQDKGPGKALTYAVKAAYLKVFLLNSADDIEKDSIDHDPEVARQSQVTEAVDKATSAQIGFMNSLKLAIDKADSIDAVELIEAETKIERKTLPETTQVYFKDLFAETKRKMVEE